MMMGMMYYQNEWLVKETAGDIFEYQLLTLLTGAAQNIDLSIFFPMELHRIELFSDDATAKSFTERIFSGGIDPASYDQLINVTLDTNQAIAYYPSANEGKYTQSPIRIRTAISASTAGKTLTKKIVVKRLE